MTRAFSCHSGTVSGPTSCFLQSALVGAGLSPTWRQKETIIEFGYSANGRLGQAPSNHSGGCRKQGDGRDVGATTCCGSWVAQGGSTTTRSRLPGRTPDRRKIRANNIRQDSYIKMGAEGFEPPTSRV
jgi:hypothetical protein